MQIRIDQVRMQKTCGGKTGVQQAKAQPGGFTLIELLLAITITALISGGVWQLLGGTLRSQEILERQTVAIDALQRTMMFLDRDMRQVSVRPVRNQFGDPEYALSNRNSLYKIEFTRSGWRNPLQHKRSNLQRVAYELHDSTLLRTSWTVLDKAHDSEPRSMELMTGIDDIRFEFVLDNDSLVDEWPPDSVLGTENYSRFISMPVALKVTLKHALYGEIYRVFDMPHSVENKN
ncbi:MAG: type II secretion system protein GspJ [Proteobacteria bacterium]|nr:MAG: type II secretion system protein GspJ [Pseudomonadota bacterium]